MELLLNASVHQNFTATTDYFIKLHESFDYDLQNLVTYTPNGTIIVDPKIENRTLETDNDPPAVTGEKIEKAPGCLKSYQSCVEDGTISDYDDATFHNRTLGTMITVLTFLPVIVFWIAVWPY